MGNDEWRMTEVSEGRRGAVRVAVGVLATVVFLAVLTVAFHNFLTSRYPGANDYYARWRPMRAWLFEGRSPYDDSVTRDTQLGMYGRPALPREDKGLFSYPFFSVIFFAPFALVASYAWSSAAWLAVLLACLLALLPLSLAWAGWRPAPLLFVLTALFGLAWYPAVRALFLGQFAAIEAVLIVGALLAVRARRDEWAGVLLALSLTKFQLVFLLIPGLMLWALAHRRWKLIAWFGGAAAALMGGSLLLMPTWIGEWRAQLGIYVEQTFIGSPVAVITEWLLPGAGHWPEAVVSGGLMLYLLWEWWRARGDAGGARWEWAASLTLVITNLVGLRVATSNYVVMTPALFWVFSRWGKRSTVWVALAQAVLFIGLWALFLATVRGNQEQALMYPPLPILLFAGLLAVRPGSVNGRNGWNG